MIMQVIVRISWMVVCAVYASVEQKIGCFAQLVLRQWRMWRQVVAARSPQA